MSCVPFDIHNPKLTIVELHFAKANKTYNYLVLSINLNNIPYDNSFMEGKTTFGHRCILKHFNQTLFTNLKGK
jgi:hypothetical protein